MAIDFNMKSTKSGELLWAYKNKLVLDTSGDDSGGLLAKLIATAITTAAQNYVPIARKVNVTALTAIPFGKYHNLHDKDQAVKIFVTNN